MAVAQIVANWSSVIAVAMNAAAAAIVTLLLCRENANVWRWYAVQAAPFQGIIVASSATLSWTREGENWTSRAAALRTADTVRSARLTAYCRGPQNVQWPWHWQHVTIVTMMAWTSAAWSCTIISSSSGDLDRCRVAAAAESHDPNTIVRRIVNHRHTNVEAMNAIVERWAMTMMHIVTLAAAAVNIIIINVCHQIWPAVAAVRTPVNNDDEVAWVRPSIVMPQRRANI